MNTATRVQILDEAICISHCANILGKVLIKLFSFQLYVNSRAHWLFNLGMCVAPERVTNENTNKDIR